MRASLVLACLAAVSGVPYDTPAIAAPRFHAMPIQRLSPRAFPGLPPVIMKELESRGCTIPQTWLYGEPGNPLYKKPHNVVRGAFRGKGRTDWAVLCSERDSSAIRIFWGGSASNPAVLAKARDEDWTQDVDGKGNLGYSRMLGDASPQHILRHDPGLRPPPSHDGVEESFVEKGSSIYYFDGGRWLSLQGAD